MLPNSINDTFLLDFIKEHASIGTWEFDVNSTLLHWSSETKKIHGVHKDFVPNVELGIQFYKEGYSRDTISKLFMESVENHKKFDTELQIVTAKGQDKWIRAIGLPIIKNNICVAVQGLFQDIDEKTKIVKILAVKEEQLRKTFENALVGMATLDIEGNWINVNSSLQETLGYTKEELKKLTFRDITHPEDLNVCRKAIIDMRNGKTENYQTEKRYIKKNGETIWTLLSTSIVRSDDGKPLHFIAQINDITEIKNSTKKVNELLETTNNQNERLLNFAHIVSHNLRSHYSNLDMLLDIVKIDLPETTKNEIFPMIEEAVKQLGETVENLNEVAAINTKTNYKVEVLNLLHYINKATASINAIIIDSNTKICVDVSAGFNINGIPAYLDSILLNFLTNAIKYRKPDEGAKIEITASEKNDYIVLEIKDHGLGIDLKTHGEKLFGMYKTFHKHKDARGLGLFITKNQIEAIGGKIEVKSEVNVGTTFNINLIKHD